MPLCICLSHKSPPLVAAAAVAALEPRADLFFYVVQESCAGHQQRPAGLVKGGPHGCCQLRDQVQHPCRQVPVGISQPRLHPAIIVASGRFWACLLAVL